MNAEIIIGLALMGVGAAVVAFLRTPAELRYKQPEPMKEAGAEYAEQYSRTERVRFILIGLALNESAYMAEIVRAGIDSVPEGQREASTALGMSWRQTTIRTVLPQAMRVIIPPTGNEVISMLKTTSLVTAIPFTLELTGRARDISAANYQPIPLLIVAATWYLAVTSILMVGQYYLERYYSKGATRKLTAKQLRALADAEGVPPRNIEITDEPQGGTR